MDIQMRKDGSGRLVMEYRISRMAETLGRLDGNENWPIIPVGRADWERTIARNPGIRLVSFSSGEETRDSVTKVTLEYDNAEALLKFLDPSESRASLHMENQSGRLNIILNEPVSSQYDEDLFALMRNVSGGYNFSISFSADGNSVLEITDGMGRSAPVPDSAEIVPSGRKVSLSIGIMDILAVPDGLGVIFSW